MTEALFEFPCRFPIKVMVEIHRSSSERLAVITAHAGEIPTGDVRMQAKQ